MIVAYSREQSSKQFYKIVAHASINSTRIKRQQILSIHSEQSCQFILNKTEQCFSNVTMCLSIGCELFVAQEVASNQVILIDSG